jgi:predicted nucleic acid-binding protein
MPDRFFLDSNVCLYILDKQSPKFGIAKSLLQGQPRISTQVILENVSVCVKKFKLSKRFALSHAKSLQQACEVIPVSNQTITKTGLIFERYDYSIFDCLILAAAINARCKILYTEDMQHGQVIEDQITIVNPFVVPTTS